MSAFREVFPKRHTFLVVIHAECEVQTMRNIAIARDNGADGVFLINHEIQPTLLIQFYVIAQMLFPGFWIGMNLLGLEPIEAIDMVPSLGVGLWVDDAGIRNSGDCSEAQTFLAYRSTEPWHGLYFGGVAFKGQEAIDDVAQVAKLAIPFMDVVTTSGTDTGRAPDTDKIRLMKKAIGDHPLAIASGITPENVHAYLPFADCFLVATGISKSDKELHPPRVRMLADRLK